MSFRSLSLISILAGVVMGTLLPAHGQQPSLRRGRAINFSEPKYDSGVASNLNAIASQKAAFHNLDEELKRPSDLFDVGDPLQGRNRQPLPQLPPPTLNSKRARELFEKKRERENWPFQSPDDQKFGLTAEEIFKLPEYDSDGKVKEKKSPVEVFYERLDRERAGMTNQLRTDELPGFENRNGGRDNPVAINSDKSPGLAAGFTAAGWKESPGLDVGSELGPDSGRPQTLVEMLTTQAQPVESPEMVRAQAARLAEFKQLLESKTPLPAASSFNSTPALAPLNRALPGFEPSAAAPARSAVQPPPTGQGSYTPTVGLPTAPAGLPGLNPILPQPEPARAAMPPSSLNIPKRKF